MSDQPEVARTLAEVADLQHQLQQAYESGDAAGVDRLVSELSAAERRRNRAMQRAVAADQSSYRPVLPVREQVIRVLDLLGCPAPVSLIRQVAAARYGDQIPGPRLASLRRDEHRSWRSAHVLYTVRAAGRPVYVVPALTYDQLVPVRGLLALSSWPLALRLIAPASPRVDLLHMVDRLAEELAEHPQAAWAPELERVLWRLAGSVPGAIDGAPGLHPSVVRDAVVAELSGLDAADRAERTAAADRFRNQAEREELLFGANP
jgi:hypothetical protein